ncbi:hypothetical protein D3C71_1679220 [compost metagenome]
MTNGGELREVPGAQVYRVGADGVCRKRALRLNDGPGQGHGECITHSGKFAAKQVWDIQLMYARCDVTGFDEGDIGPH